MTKVEIQFENQTLKVDEGVNRSPDGTILIVDQIKSLPGKFQVAQISRQGTSGPGRLMHAGVVKGNLVE